MGLLVINVVFGLDPELSWIVLHFEEPHPLQMDLNCSPGAAQYTTL